MTCILKRMINSNGDQDEFCFGSGIMEKLLYNVLCLFRQDRARSVDIHVNLLHDVEMPKGNSHAFRLTMLFAHYMHTTRSSFVPTSLRTSTEYVLAARA